MVSAAKQHHSTEVYGKVRGLAFRSPRGRQFHGNFLLLLRVLRILRRRRAWRPARRPRWLADRLTNWLTKTGAGLHARLTCDQHIFRRVPDKFEKAVVLRVIVNDYRLPVDLAPDSNDVSAYDRRSIVARNGRIGVRARIRSLICGNGISACSRRIARTCRLRPRWSLRSESANLSRHLPDSRAKTAVWSTRRCQGSCGRAHSGNTAKLKIRAGLQATDELPARTDIDESP